ncbi:MAG: peptidoglycan DD-metalloendopeptidase family protein [Rhodospirillaceae bacterium]|nr:peptidoglycan DD-metalloendopeptidase family protein [Rhodospirillaceae bacterium]
MSKFDPHKRSLSDLQRWLQRFFPERQIILRTEEHMHTLRLTTMRQVIAASLFIVVGSWLLVSSSLVVSHGDRIRAKNIEVKDAKSGYEQLLAQLTVYKRRIDEITEELDENNELMVSLVDRQVSLFELKTPQETFASAARERKPDIKRFVQNGRLGSDPEQIEVAIGRIELERDRISEERADLHTQLENLKSGMADVTVVHQGAEFIDPKTLELRQLVIERDLRSAERDVLVSRVGELENQLREMESTHLLLFHRFSEVAEEQIQKIQTSLSTTGIEVDILLDARRSETGSGGPYIPLESFPGDEGPLHESLVSLNLKVERLTELQNLTAVMPLGKPLKKYWITSGFGVRKDPILGKYARHLGLDFGGPYKSAILSPGEGKVVYAGWRGRYGRLVEIDHGMGLTSRYGHMAKISVTEGEYVGRGTEIGLLGNSGRSTGAHLHLEVLYKGKQLNPLQFMRAGSDVLEQE